MATAQSTDPEAAASPRLPVLPPEIFERILSEYDPSCYADSILDTWDIQRACLVSKAFQVIAERILYREVSVVCHEILRTHGLRGGKFGGLEKLCKTLLGKKSTRKREDAERRRGYVREIKLSNLRCAPPLLF